MSFHLSHFYRLVLSIFLMKVLTISYYMCGGLHQGESGDQNGYFREWKGLRNHPHTRTLPGTVIVIDWTREVARFE